MTDSKFTTEELANEIWKPVPEWERFYSVSNLGRIRRDSPNPVNGWGKGRLLNPSDDGKGYRRVKLTQKGRHLHAHVYRLVALAFIGPLPKGFHVDHVDANKMNDRLGNLEHVTGKENHRRAAAKGLYASGKNNGHHTKPERTPRGSTHPMARIDRPKAEAILRLRRVGQTLESIAGEFNVSTQTIRRVLLGNHWALRS